MANSLKFQPQITSLLLGVQNKDARLYDLLHAMINDADQTNIILNRLTGGAGASFVPATIEDYFDALKKVSLRL